MLSVYSTKSFLPAALRRQLCSPSTYPAVSHAILNVAAPAALRHKSTAVAVKEPTAAPDFTSRFFDVDDFFPFFSGLDLKPFARQMDLENDLRRDRFFSPGYEVSSNDSNVKINVDLPGVKLEDVNIEVKDDKFLKIDGGRKVERDGSISELRFERRFTLSPQLDQSKIEANLSDGVLTITLPKKELVENVKKIPITQASE